MTITMDPTPSGSSPALVTSLNDKRSYRHLTLPNNLRCILIHDEHTEKSSACVDVMIGSLCDPKEAQGLAHFLEHMLFMGTTKYPIENEYSSYLSSHGGYSNAYTSQENTVYYFDVQPDHLEGALDRFAAFFTCPLLSDSSTSREVNAVDSENTKNLQVDSWRKFQLLKSLARDDHPLSSFSTGNLQTLKEVPESQGMNIRDMVVGFYHQYYSANQMRLVVYGKEPLDQLEQWVRDKFTAVPNQELPRPVFPSDPFSESQLRRCAEVVPIKDVKALTIYFPVPEVSSKYIVKPDKYYGHLLGHESGGSILSALKQRLWASGLSSGIYLDNNDFACFSVSVELSNEGVHHVDEIVSCVFAYIGMLRRLGAQEWVWRELKETAEMNFRFLEKTEPSDYSVEIANGMHVYSAEHSICGRQLFFEWDSSLVDQYLSCFTPHNSFLIVSHLGFTGKTTLKERWYGTDYNLQQYSAEQLLLWEAAMGNDSESQQQWNLSLPLPNPFIPTDFSLKTQHEDAGAVPVLIEQQIQGAAVLDCLVEQDRPALSVSSQEDVVEKPLEHDEQHGEAGAQDGVDEGEEEGEEGEEEGEEGNGEGEGQQVAVAAVGELPPIAGEKLFAWFLNDRLWGVPKLNVKLMLETSWASSSSLAVTLTEVFSLCLKELLNEYSYYADCAGLCYDIQLSKGGLDISVQGYGHRLPVLLEKIAGEIQRVSQNSSSHALSGDLFQLMKEKTLRSLKNYLFWQPYYHSMLGSLLCLEDGRYSSSEKHQSLSAASFDDFQSFAAQLVKQMKAQVLIHGNVTAAEAKALTQLILSKIPFDPLPHSQVPIRRLVRLREGTSYLYRQHAVNANPNEINSATENIYMVGQSYGSIDTTVEGSCNTSTSTEELLSKDDIVNEASLELLVHMISEPAFDQLRTKEQLGYIVYSAIKRLNSQYLAMHIIVQSSHKDPDYLDHRIEDFLVQYRQQLAAMASQEYQAYVHAVIEKLVEKPKNLNEETEQYWHEIKSAMFWFPRKQVLANVLRSEAFSTSARVLQFFDRFISATNTSNGNSNSSRVKFSSQFYGKSSRYIKAQSTQVVMVHDPALFKRSMPLDPVPVYTP